MHTNQTIEALMCQARAWGTLRAHRHENASEAERRLREMLKHALAAATAAQPVPWITVAERLPQQDGAEVIVYAPAAAVSKRWPAKWDAENCSFAAGAGWFEQDEVTHWMPAPIVPATGATGG